MLGLQTGAKPMSSSEANILQFAPTASRFGYLPISTPSATAAGLQQLPAAGVSRGKISGVSPCQYNFDICSKLIP